LDKGFQITDLQCFLDITSLPATDSINYLNPDLTSDEHKTHELEASEGFPPELISDKTKQTDF